MIYCKTESSFNGEDTDIECGYGADFCCEECICLGGTMSPQTLKPFRGNRNKYIEMARNRYLNKNKKSIEIDFKFGE